jgi:hypothetical protein
MRITIATIAFCGLIMGSGCAGPLSRLCAEDRCIPHCNEKIQIGIVNVGGKVHETRRLEVGPDGLTLRNALMAAGGPRDSEHSDANIPSDPEGAAKVRELISQARTLGKIEADEDLYVNLGAQAAKFVPQSAKQLIADRKTQKEVVDNLVTDLSSTFDVAALKSLRGVSQELGHNMENSRLYGNAEFHQITIDDLGWTEGDVESAVSRLAEQEKTARDTLFDVRQKINLRSLQTDFFFVSLERPTANPRVTYYFPYDLVVDGMASEISLRDGDVVNVVDIASTNLVRPDTGRSPAGNNVAIQGYIETPGIAEGVTTLGGVGAFSPTTIDDPRSVWLLVRPGPTGQSQRIFVLPTQMLAANGAVADAPTQAGDVYTLTVLPQVPIVLETLLERTLKGGKEKCLQKVHERAQQRKQECENRVRCVRNQLSNCLNLIPTPPPIAR